MDLRPSLNHYEEHTFLAFVERIWNVETDRASHDAWINHFNEIVDHPEGSDLLFHPASEDEGVANSPETVVETIRFWYQRNGRAAFKDQAAPVHPTGVALTREQQASRSSHQNLNRIRNLVKEVHEVGYEVKLASLQQHLAISPPAGNPEQQLAADLAALKALENAQHQAKAALGQLTRLQSRIEAERQRATRDASSAFLDKAIQAIALTEINAASQLHAAALADAQARHPALYDQGVRVIEQLEVSIADLARTTSTGPGYEPLTLKAAVHSASLHPALLTAGGLRRDIAQQQHHFTKTLRSALAELEWQATTAHGKHPGIYADIAEFVLSTPSDDRRFAFTVPLATLSDDQVPEWQTVSNGGIEMGLSVRLCSIVSDSQGATSTGVKPFTCYSHVVMTPTTGLSSKVRVRAAVWNRSMQCWMLATDGDAPVTLLWQGGNRPYAPEDPARPPTIGFLSMPTVPLLRSFSDLTQVEFDDYIVVFPQGSGLDPVYLMFRDRREF